eukprot:c34661_g1_i1 orf=31-219(-)
MVWYCSTLMFLVCPDSFALIGFLCPFDQNFFVRLRNFVAIALMPTGFVVDFNNQYGKRKLRA